MIPPRYLVLLSVILLSAVPLRAQDVAKDQAEPTTTTTSTSTTGLPTMIDWTFHFDASWGGFGFGNSYYTDPHQGVPQNYGERWMEGFVKPSISGSYAMQSMGEIYGTLSAVGERTYANPPSVVGPVEASFLPEDLSLGWRSGTMWEGLGKDALDVTVGRTQYRLGHGFLLWDGAAEGGSRGGYWSNARKAFGFATIVRFKPRQHTFESFYLKKDDLPERVTGSRLWGGNYEFRIGETSTFGATYMKWYANEFMLPERNGLNVYNVRAFTAPFPKLKDLSFEAEYAAERKPNTVQADAWTAQAGYEFSAAAWTPKVAYRYAFFSGDNPATPKNESFDSLFPGFYDWGYWWQGEIAGEYFLSNSNLKSHLVRVHVAPNKKVGTGVMVYKFLLDHPESYAPGVTSNDVALEVDGYTDWKINKNFTASFVAAFGDPHQAVQQASGRTANFRYGMVYLAYSY